MTLEKLALMGIVIFAFMALVKMLSSVREAKKSTARRMISKRPRRQVGSEASARQIADGLVGEVAGRWESEARQAAETGVIPAKLESDLDKAMAHYKERVVPRFRGLFYESINQIILKRQEPR